MTDSASQDDQLLEGRKVGGSKKFRGLSSLFVRARALSAYLKWR